MEINTRIQFPYNSEFTYETTLSRINLEKEMEADYESGLGFQIKEPQKLTKTLKSPDSIYSEKFMKTLQDPDAFSDRYSCAKGCTKGIDNARLICPICGTEVKFIGDNFEIFGWIQLKDPYKIIHPNLYKSLERYIGASTLLAIIEPDVDLNENGNPMSKLDRKIYEKKLKRKYVKHSKVDKTFAGIGMEAFMERFDEILEYYHEKNKLNKLEYYDDIIKNRDKVFTASIPVYSTGMRPFKVENGVFTFEGTNAIFNIMAKLAGKINADSLGMHKLFKYRSSLLFDLQDRYNVLYKEIEKTIAGKKGNIRLLIGGRCAFTTRSVIIPDITLRTDEIRLPYHALVEMLQQTIINVLVRTYNITYAKAYSIWYKAQISPNPRVRDIVENLIKYHNGIPVIINRNPTIQFGSILMMRCIGINDAFVMSVPLTVLPGLAADFDGDCLNILYVPNQRFVEIAMDIFNPRNRMVISPNDGKFNNQMNVNKDILINANALINLGRDSYTDEELSLIRDCKLG